MAENEAVSIAQQALASVLTSGPFCAAVFGD
jgi:hypothetical protein